MSSPGYPNPVPIAEVLARVAQASRTGNHEFWPDDVSLTDTRVFEHRAILGPRQITDRYLLALGVKRGGRLVTFDQGILPNAVHGATAAQIVQLRG